MADKPIFKKEGQAAGAVGAIITLIVGIGVSVLVLIFVGTLAGRTYQLQESKIDAIGVGAHSQVNDTIIPLNATNVSLTHNNIEPGSIAIRNDSAAIGLDNFTFHYPEGYVELTSMVGNGSNMNFSYDYANMTIRNSIKSAVVSGFEALEETGDFLPIIVLAVVISLVLALVLGFTAFGPGQAGGRGTAL